MAHQPILKWGKSPAAMKFQLFQSARLNQTVLLNTETSKILEKWRAMDVQLSSLWSECQPANTNLFKRSSSVQQGVFSVNLTNLDEIEVVAHQESPAEEEVEQM